MHATTVAVDLAKDVFEMAFADAHYRIVERERLSRNAFSKCLLNRPPLRVVMEACGSAHHWARVFQAQGHSVLKSQRTSLLNLLRGVLREFGIVMPMGTTKVKPGVRDALEDATTRCRSRQCDGCAVLSPKVAGNLIQSIQFTARPLASC